MAGLLLLPCKHNVQEGLEFASLQAQCAEGLALQLVIGADNFFANMQKAALVSVSERAWKSAQGGSEAAPRNAQILCSGCLSNSVHAQGLQSALRVANKQLLLIKCAH